MTFLVTDASVGCFFCIIYGEVHIASEVTGPTTASEAIVSEP